MEQCCFLIIFENESYCYTYKYIIFILCVTANYQQSSRLMSFVGCNCLLQLPSSSKVTNIESSTIMNVILIKSIENTYIAPILKELNLNIEVKDLLL